MRVVAGTAGGRRLEAPSGKGTRPTGDRVREAVFNALGSMGVVEGATVVDLFAGSGALGIEALSRGAATATFVDDDGSALATVRANLATTGLAGAATVVRGCAEAWVDGGGRADLALLDPPYAYGDDSWSVLLDGLDADVVVIESDREVDVGDRWVVARAKKYGTTVVVFAERRR